MASLPRGMETMTLGLWIGHRGRGESMVRPAFPTQASVELREEPIVTGIYGRSGFMAGRATRTWLAGLSAAMLAFGVMAAAAPAGAGDEEPRDIPGQCDPGYTKIADDYRGGLSWTADADYSVVVLVGGPPDPEHNKDPRGRKARFEDVEVGDTISRTEHDISHICAIPAPEDEASVEVVKDVRGDEGARTEAFDILVGTRARNVTMTFADGGSHTFFPAVGTGDFAIAEQAIDEDGWSTSVSCVSDQRERFGARGASIVIDEIMEGEDIVCTVINTYEADDVDDDDDDSSTDGGTSPVTVPEVEVENPCFDGTAENEEGECVAPESEEVVVLGVQIEETTTTVEAVTLDTLPFTGDDTNGPLIAGLLLFVAGASVLGASILVPSLARTGRHVAPSRSITRWGHG